MAKENNPVNNDKSLVKTEEDKSLNDHDFLDISREVFRHLSEDSTTTDTIKSILVSIHKLGKFDAIAMRIKNGDDYPFYCSKGFSDEFILEDDSLLEYDSDGELTCCGDGNAKLMCTCGLVINGMNSSSNLFTERGSFFTGNTSEILNLSPSKDPRLSPRNRCINYGFRSMTIIPIKNSSQTIGVLQLYNELPYSISLDTISYFEDLTNSIGVALVLKNSRQEILEREKAYKSLVSGMPDVVVRVDLYLNYLFVSQNISVYTDLIPEDFIGRPILDAGLEHNVCLDCREIVLEAIRSESLTESELDVCTKIGWRVFNCRVVPEYNDVGDICSTLCVFKDITQSITSEKKLQESRNRFSMVLNLSPDTIFIVRRSDGLIIDVNSTCNKMFGVTREEAIGKTTVEIGMWRSAKERCELLDSLKNDFNVSDFSLKLRKKSGERFDAVVHADVVEIDGELCIVSTVRDVSERLLLNEKLRQNEKMSAIGQLVGGIAHDFNNQLTGIVGYSDFLTSNLQDETLKGYAQNILTCAARSTDLTQQLLAFSRKGKYKSVPLDVHDLISEVVLMLDHSIDKKISMKQVLEATTYITKGDSSQLQNAILNLALNARDAIHDGGSIIFKTSNVELGYEYCDSSPYPIKPGRFLSVKIIDNGMGMDEGIMSKVFEPFFTTKEEGNGTGMGLAAVYGTVKEQEGAIEVASVVGVGTTFTILLPEHFEEQNNTESDCRPLIACGHVLLVDTQEVVRTLGIHMLKELGYKVTACSNGEDAIEIYDKQSNEIDMVIIDMDMPKMNGYETFVAMKEINDAVVAVLSVGYNSKNDVAGLINSGVREVIAKPFRLADLSNVVETILSSH